MVPRCKVGDLAFIKKAIIQENVGRVVSVVQYIGFLSADEQFEYNGIACRVPVTDHYWWITSKTPLETPVGPTNKAYGADMWLEPIKPDLLDTTEETGDEVYNIIPVSA